VANCVLGERLVADDEITPDGPGTTRAASRQGRHRLRLRMLWLLMWLGPVGFCCGSEICRIDLVDAENGWPVPLVELRTTNHQRFVSDNAGVIAIDTPDVLGQDVWFDVHGHGYEVPADGFGSRGVRLSLTAGSRHEVKLQRTSIAKRLGRLTGAGLFAESERAGTAPGWRESPGVFGCDSVQTAAYRGKLFWAWGDTSVPWYPLGVFDTLAATTPVRPLEVCIPPLALTLEHVREPATPSGPGRVRGVCRMPGPGPTWISGLTAFHDPDGNEHLGAVYTKIAGQMEPYESGLCVWNDATGEFDRHRVVWEKTSGQPRPPLPEGHVTTWRDAEGHDWLLYGDPFPVLRCRAEFAAWADPQGWESLAPPAAPVAADGGKPVKPHRGSVARLPSAGGQERWVAIFTESFGKPSAFGEIWYAEAASPLGPWGAAVKVLSHDNYSFYNPMIHTELTAEAGVLLFEGTYSHTFADHQQPTPRYDYNQVLYRIDLDDPALAAAAEVRQTTARREPLEVTGDITLDPSVTYGAIVVKASGVVIDGRGAILRGSAADASTPAEFEGIAVLGEGVDNVTLKNVRAHGWETGLVVRDATGWQIENCDFSDNFHDPAFGWGENGRRGGMLLERVRSSTLRGNRANRVWDGCVLVECEDNLLEANDFSHTSNTCLKLWTSCRNRVHRNQMTHGIRMDPGEVHARDSTSVLVESGSNDNQFIDNTCTHGGDGIFVRVLNGWNSTGNLFEGNDCSYANNNGFECWAPGNTFVGNKANHCSYGFWLGGSDRTRLIGNEASWNGLPSGHHNSPHLPDGGHAGIVFMFGTSSHILARGNRCEGNQGAGIALVGDLAEGGPAWKAYHWVLQGNTLVGNRQGIYAKHVDWIVLDGNVWDGNVSGNLVTDGEVTRLEEAAEAGQGRLVPVNTDARLPRVRLSGPGSLIVGQEAAFGVADVAGEQPLHIEWDAGEGQVVEAAEIRRRFQNAGVATVAANVVIAGLLEPLAATVFVTERGREIGTEGQASAWRLIDFHERTQSPAQFSRARFSDVAGPHVVGEQSIAITINPYAGFRAAMRYPADGDLDLPVGEQHVLSFWIKAINADTTGWQGGPFITLHGSDGTVCHLEPAEGHDLMRERAVGEKADDWRLMRVPLCAIDTVAPGLWQRSGALPQRLQAISIAVDSWGAPPLSLWLDGLMLREVAEPK
jgi:parallel beta-helix repeat protein